ncbi:MAG: hypothetical protein NC131_17555 [Roseburia sp.]|nr:hypothetical protein [Roseburia sp.]
MPRAKDNLALCSGYLCPRSLDCERYIEFRRITKYGENLKFDPNITFMSSVYNPVSDYCSKQIPIKRTMTGRRKK